MSNRRFVSLLTLASLSCLAPLSGQTTANVSRMVDTYCAGCHNGVMKSPSAQLLSTFDASAIAANPSVWARVYRHLQAGTMPPVGAKRPDRAAYDVVLVSIEQAMPGSDAGSNTNSPQIANRLATLLWNGAPDAALLEDAQNNRLNDSVVLDRQIHRMLADDRAQAFVSRFFFPWLQLDRLEKADPDKKLFPDYDVSLRDSLAKETELFILSQLRDDRDPLELWSAKYTFLNEQLAKHYGIANVSGSQFRRVELAMPERAGLLGQGSIQMATSRHQQGMEASYTSPASRGVWVLTHFLGVQQPNPFPGALPVKPELPITPQTRALPMNPCVTCHQNFFPLGYALENFDTIGRWRTHDQAGPADASGNFIDGSSIKGVNELRQALLQRPDAFRTAITERLLTYVGSGTIALNQATPETLVRARQILRGTQKPSWSTIIAGVVLTKSGE